MNPYSTLKATRHLDIIEAVRAGRPARPAHVQIILSDLCNHACNFCAYRDPAYTSSQLFREPGDGGLQKVAGFNFNPNRMIPLEKAIEILDDCQSMGVSGVQFTGGGEPTVHPQFAEIVTAAHQRGLAYALVTNGTRVATRKLAPLLATAAWVRVSIDAGDSTTYTRVRHVPEGHFEYPFEAITQLRRERDHQGTKTVIGAGFVVTPDNWQGILRCAELAKEAGADNIRISAQFSAEDETLFRPFYREAADMCAAAERLSGDGFQVFARFGDRLSDLEQKAPDYPRCGYQHFTTYIGADLNLYRCCVYAYNEQGKYGDIKHTRLKDAWLTQDRADQMAAFDPKQCERCQFNTINRNLDYILDPIDPEHAEFV
jgi:radical SAM protein with 4Fe4S-binding SPASM domain